MHRAGAALSDAAAELGAGQPDDVAQRPKQGHRGIGIDRQLAVIYN
jgi:hypothetical protein